MRWWRALLPGLLVLAAGAPLRADPVAARTVLKQCTEHAAATRRGIEALRAECPQVATALADLGLDALLPANWKKRISPAALTDIGILEQRYSQPPGGSTLSSASLRTIAQHLSQPPAFGSWWERFKTWLASWLASDRNRWPDWMRYLPNLGAGARYFVYGAVALLVIAAVAVIVVELRAAGVGGARQRRTRRKRPAIAGPTFVAGAVFPTDLEAAPEHLRAVVLLRLLVTALNRSQRIERDGVLTCRELIRAARFDTPMQREIFSSVALSAERVLYGDPRTPPGPLQSDLLSGARGLYGELVAAAVGQPAK
jgi:hypothetical protein